MKSVRDIPEILNAPILVRAALNVPVENGVVTNEYRLRKALPTIRFLADRGARVVVISHIDPPPGGDGVPRAGTETLLPVANAMKRLTTGVSFCPETVGERARDAVRNLASGEILVLENLRRNAGETTNDPAFAKELASLADIFVEDSFDTCHRMHASIVGVPKLLPSYAGLLLEAEVTALTDATTPKHPALAVIGGAKFHTKEGVLTALLEHYDHVFVGGALGNDFLKASGSPVGRSLVSDADTPHVKALLKNPKLVIPEDSVVIPASAVGSMGARLHARVAAAADVKDDDVILDIGPATVATLAGFAKKSKSVLWNGPLGNYENGFMDGTNGLARAIATCGAHSVVGGGDTVAAIETLGYLSRFSFVSTGGGAMLSFIANGTLPGVSALG